MIFLVIGDSMPTQPACTRGVQKVCGLTIKRYQSHSMYENITSQIQNETFPQLITKVVGGREVYIVDRDTLVPFLGADW